MTQISSAADIAALDVPKDAWTQPFWNAAETGSLRFPQCGDCGRFRWRPGPFRPACQSQAVNWIAPSGAARLYSFTIVPDEGSLVMPVLVEFDGIDHVRLLASIVDTPLNRIRVGAELTLGWSRAQNVSVAVFHVS